MVAWRRTDFRGLRSNPAVPSLGNGPEGKVLERRSVGVTCFSAATASRGLHPALGSSAMKVAQRQSSPSHDAPAAVEVSIVMPCLNEVETLATCIAKAREAIDKGGYSAEIIVADNGSSDGSQLVARELGA